MMYCYPLLAAALLLVLQPPSLATATATTTTCGPEELNHSVLVECNRTLCGPVHQQIQRLRPSDNSDEVLLISSSHAGIRLAPTSLINMNLIEDPWAKLLDINTTFTIKTNPGNNNNNNNRIVGFGASISLNKWDESKHSLVMEDLFGTPTGAGLNLLRIYADAGHADLRKLVKMLQEVDQLVANLRNYNTQIDLLKIVLDLGKSQRSTAFVNEIPSILDSLSSIEIYAVVFECMDLSSHEVSYAHYYELVRSRFRNTMILASVDIDEAPACIMNDSMKTSALSNFDGLLLRAKTSHPYNILDYIKSEMQNKVILTLGSVKPKTRDYGDWFNAQNHVIEIMNHLKHGSLGYIEQSTVNDVLMEETPSTNDSSLYNLNMPYKLFHYQGPMYYAMSHFSRYIMPRSQILTSELFTQPNMFSAHYAGFRTHDNHIVAIVLNSNDHLLPFRLEIDKEGTRRVVGHVGLEPKSFNTLIVRGQ